MIERSVFRVELLALRLHVVEAVVRRLLRIEHREAIAHQLAMFDQRALNRRAGAPGNGDDADLLLVAQAVETGATEGFWRIISEVGIVIDRPKRRHNRIIAPGQTTARRTLPAIGQVHRPESPDPNECFARLHRVLPCPMHLLPKS